MSNTAAERRIHRWIENALDRAFEDIYDYVNGGYCTGEDILTALQHIDVADSWTEYLEG